MMVLRRSWITIVALLGTALGYLLNDVVHSLGSAPEARTPTAVSERQ
jgi:hypothetical protein